MHDADICRAWTVRERAERLLAQAKLPSRMEATFKVTGPNPALRSCRMDEIIEGTIFNFSEWMDSDEWNFAVWRKAHKF
jgi:hypothetical protein